MENNKQQKDFEIKLSISITETTKEKYSSTSTVYSGTKNKTMIANNFSTTEEFLEEIKNHFQETLKETSQFIKNRPVLENEVEKENELSI